MELFVLDFCGNGGGLLIEVVNIVNMFVKKDQIVVMIKGCIKDENCVYKMMNVLMDLNILFVVLVDGGFVFVSEIVVGSLQDLDCVVIIGMIFYGKGLVQCIFDLKYGLKVKLMIFKYYIFFGCCVQCFEYYDCELGEKLQVIVDLLLKIFFMVNGWKVIDGCGIELDIKIDELKYSCLIVMLVISNIMFNYVIDFV